MVFIVKIVAKYDRWNLKELIIFLKQTSILLASAHQSMFETFALQSVLDYPVFILKKELLKIPLFGLYLKKIKSIEIVRDTTTKDNH